jgi:hypothetical protein
MRNNESVSRKTGSFMARTADGTRVELEIWTPFRPGQGRSLPPLRGRPEVYTTDGDPVKILYKGRYQVVETGMELTSDDPKAP